MLAEALDFIFRKADESANPKPVVRKLGPRTQKVTLNGETELEALEPSPLGRQANGLDSLVRLVEEFGGEKPTIYVDEAGIDCILDDSDRVEAVGMRFCFSPQFQTLQSLSAGRSQRDLVRILRTQLAGCVAHDAFLSIVRQLEFDVNRSARNNVDHTRESLGRGIEKEVRAKAGELPETVSVRVPLYDVPQDLPTEIELACAVSLDIDNEKIAIEPTGNSLAREKIRILNEIVGRLDSITPEGTVVVFGSVEVDPRHL